MKIVVYNLGCKVNQYECDSIVKELRSHGHDVSESLQAADIFILNTCAVTNEAERKSRQFVGKCNKLNPNAKIYICGCASQNDSKQFLDKENVTAVFGTADKMKLVDYIVEKIEKNVASSLDFSEKLADNSGGKVANSFNFCEKVNCNSAEKVTKKIDCCKDCVSVLPKIYEDNFSATVDRTRAYVKIQDGCDNFCSYCLIPYLRGRCRSRSVQSVIEECGLLCQQTKEIVLTGIDMSSFGKDTGSSLAKLIVELKDIDCRIRLGSLEVGVVDDEFLQATKQLKSFCPQFHLSLQSGDDDVLKKMNRHYTTAEYLQRVQLIKKYYPYASITTDLICGFPTETQQNFENGLNFLKQVGFLQIHIFGYSLRGGTVAEKYVQLEKSVIKQRVDEAEIVAKKCRDDELKKYFDTELEVLIESKEGDFWVGYSKEYIKVLVENAEQNSIVKVAPKATINGNIVGRIVEL